jgi:amino acid adenylation domain-containing protein/FkbM family methyltransferase
MTKPAGSFDLQSSDRDLFDLLLEEEELSELSVVPPIRRHDLLAAPLSFSQSRLWFLEQIELGNATYNMPGRLRMDGDLQVNALTCALLEIVRRQESLRTSFGSTDGAAQQIVESANSVFASVSRFAPGIIDISRLPEQQQTEAMRRLALEEAKAPFDLSVAPLYRATLIRMDRRQHVLFITMHHIISDEWSLSVFLQELTELYGWLVSGLPSDLSDLSVQYADYTLWQRDWLQGEMLDQQVEYWRTALDGAPASVDLPVDHPTPPAITHRGGAVTWELSGNLSEALREAARQRGVTLFMLLFAAYEILIYRYTGQEDFVIGTPVAGRDRVEVQGLIGFFVNMLPFRAQLSPELSVIQVLDRLKEMAAGAYGNQALPFELLVERLRPERDLRGSSIFNITFALEQGLPATISMPGVVASAGQTNTETAKFDLILSVVDSKPGLTANFEYRTDLFDAATIERATGHFETLLEGIIAGNRGQIAGLPLLTDAESFQLLEEWNETGADYLAGECIHQLFERQATLTPDPIAVVFEEEQLSYDHLNRRANGLANYLRGRGAGLEARVGVCAERSSEMVIALLAIMKAGGAYVPIDPDYPAERIEYMIADSDIRLIFCNENLMHRVPLPADCLLSLECIRDISSPSQCNSDIGATPENLIYVIYTSGSTGKPKAAAVPHRGVVNCLSWLQREFPIGTGDAVLVKASLSFDASVWEMFWPLIVGSKAVIASPGGHRDATYLAKAIPERKVTVCHFVPSMLRVFVDEPGIASIECLDRVLCGGEALPPETMADFLAGSRAELHNFYGPTETSIGCADWRCSLDFSRANLPIGRPIANTRLYILDRRLSPVPIGISGELNIAGECVAMGYLGRADLTADKFVPDLGCETPGARMYKSGDLCRYLATGEVEFLGRIDHQVKIRGFRIELAEVEMVLVRHESVSECLVLARGDLGADKRLVAYVIGAAGRAITSSELRSFARDKLPAFMVPSSFVLLDQLPLMPNGKVDRRALPLPDIAGFLDDEYRPPRGAVEELLASIWQEVLGAERVGRDANFFDTGGHSLLATQVVSRIRDAFRVEIPLRNIFERPVLAELAQAVRHAIRGDSGPVSAPITRSVRNRFTPLSHAQERLWLLDQLETDRSVYNIVAGMRWQGPVSVSSLEQAIFEIVRRHESLRTTFELRNGGPVQVAHPFAFHPIPLIDVSGFPEPAREQVITTLARQEASTPFDLRQGPLLKITLFTAGPCDHTLVAFVHHIVSDGWSMGVLTRELTALYKSFAGGEESALGEPEIQYSDFAVWHRDYIKSEAVADQLQYWRGRLSGAAPILELPSDRPRPAVQTFDGSTLHFELPDSLTRDVHALARRETVTLYMVLLAAFQVLLHRYSGQEDVSVGSPISNRTRKELEPLIGFFANTLVLRAQTEAGQMFRSLLRNTREATLEAYARQDVPFEMLVEAIQPVRDLSHSPLFQVLFVLQNAPQHEFAIQGVRVDPLPLDAGKAHFDLTLAMAEEIGVLHAAIEYNTGLFDKATILRLFGHFEVLLCAVSEDADRPISALPLLTEPESIQLLRDFNSTFREFNAGAAVQQCFERHASMAPDAMSVVFDGSHVSYAYLDRSTESFAAALRDAGAGPDVLVGICVERSLEMVLGLIAVLKAGGAYVPLDPTYPAERLAWMMEGIDVVITGPALAERLPATRARSVYLESGIWEAPLRAAPGRASTVAPESLAYAVYTSGSTGRPKGVAMSHYAAVKMISWQLESSAQSAGGRTLQFASLSFDVSFQEIFATLGSGGTLVLISDEDRKDPSRLLEVILGEQVERLFAPVVALHHLAEAAEERGRAPVALQEIITAGEQLKITPSVSSLFDKSPACRLFNHYGPSETHAATACVLPGDRRTWPEFPSIGGAIDNTAVYLLDQMMNPVPIGVPGETFIGGSGLARGYLYQPEMTAERFIPDPFSGKPGARLYAAGDIGRFREGGTIEFRGRSDHQVKIRGYRVEPREIELAMRGCSGVKQAVVVARESAADGKRLIAYFAADEFAAPEVFSLKAILKRQLPGYMVPAAFIRLQAFPLTGSGKIDRLSLPDPEAAIIFSEDRTEAYGSLIAQVVAEVFSSVAGGGRAGPRDNFFDLGGNSLSATRAVSKLRAAFNIDLPLRKLFESPTVAELALYIEEEVRGGKIARPPVIPRQDQGKEVPLSFAQQRIWFLTRLAPDSPAYNIAGAIRILGPLDSERIERSIDLVVSRHDILRTSFEENDGRPLQKGQPEIRFKLQRLDLASSEDAGLTRAKAIASEFARRVFDLTRPPLVAGLLIRLNDSEHVLALSMHHIVSDGASIDLFFRELSALYEACGSDGQPTLPELQLQYADYAAWQCEWLQGDVLEREIGYWKRTLDGGGEPLQLPIDRPRPLTQSFNGSTVELNISEDIEGAARQLGRQEASTLFMTLLAAFHALLHKYTGQEDISVGVPVANRGLPETEDIIGFFVNTVVIRARIDRHAGFNALVAQIRERAIEAYSHQDIPFEKLVDELQPVRDLSRSPLFQVAFAVSNPSRIPGSIADLQVGQIEIDSQTAKFDLFLSIEDSELGMKGVFEYNTDLFIRSTVERMARHFSVLTEALSNWPERPLRETSFLSAAETSQLVSKLNGAGRAGYQGPVFPEQFERATDRQPDAVALIHWDSVVTYQALNRKSNRLARLLIDAGLSAEQTVAICLTRSPDLIVAMLAALKAGLAYLPLDPASPMDRIKSLIDDARPSCLIGDPGTMAGVSASEAQLLSMDSANERAANYCAENLNVKPPEEGVAYLIYTSGSTGRPKAVAVEHRNLTNYVDGVFAAIAPRTPTSFAALSAPSADLSYSAVFPALAAGACLNIIPEELFLDGEGLADYLDARPIDVLKIVPSHLAALQSAAAPRSIVPQSVLILGGEAADAEWVRSLAELFPRVQILNHYGPTETTVGVSTFAVDGAIPETPSRTVPIGAHLGNARLYLLSEDFDPVPAGARGGLYIGGHTISRGYFDRPDATAERFLPDPFSMAGGTRMYASGDVARVLAGGAIEFLGRCDDQLKMRGYRIEPREIEHTLLAHPDVRQAVVLPVHRDPASPTVELAAYVAPQPARSASVAGHRRYLLPNNMAIVHANKNETDYLYKEVFELQAYLRFGTRLDRESVVFDVGANIGLFTLFVKEVAESPEIFAFEPNPRAYELLRLNTGLYAPNARLFNYGLGSREGIRDFTFFPEFTLLSGLHGDSATEKQVVKRFIANQAAAEGIDISELLESSELLDQRFRSEILQVKLRTLSDVIEENKIDRIDFLKINVEKSELDVLEGIRDSHWGRIGQVVLEVDLRDNLSRITRMLDQRGYDVNVFQDKVLAGTDLNYVYARQRETRKYAARVHADRTPAAIPQLPNPFLIASELETFLRERLPAYMVPQSISIVDEIPISANGKIDRNALKSRELRYNEEGFVAPASSMERAIASVWQEVLNAERAVCVNDNFFAVGGNSLLLAQVCGKLRRTVIRDVSIIELFKYPTVRALARHLSGNAQAVAIASSASARGLDRRKAAGLRARSVKAVTPGTS